MCKSLEYKLYTRVYRGIQNAYKYLPWYTTVWQCIPGHTAHTRVCKLHTRIYQVTEGITSSVCVPCPGITSGVGVLTMHWCLPYIGEHWYVLCVGGMTCVWQVNKEAGIAMSRRDIVLSHWGIVTSAWDIMSQQATPALCRVLTQLTPPPPTIGLWAVLPTWHTFT